MLLLINNPLTRFTRKKNRFSDFCVRSWQNSNTTRNSFSDLVSLHVNNFDHDTFYPVFKKVWINSRIHVYIELLVISISERKYLIDIKTIEVIDMLYESMDLKTDLWCIHDETQALIQNFYFI